MNTGRLTRTILVSGACAFAGCGPSSAPAPGSPSVPTAVPAPAPQPRVDIPVVKGVVVDTAQRRLDGVAIHVINGPGAGLSTISDTLGSYALSGSFDATTIVSASRADHRSASRAVGDPKFSSFVSFVLQPTAAPVDLTGNYLLTFAADPACGQLPNEFRTRTYTAAVRQFDRSSFMAALGGARFDDYYNFIWIGVAGDYVAFDFSDNVVLEEPDEGTYFMIGGGDVGASAGSPPASTISAPFGGFFDYCVTRTELEFPYLRDSGATAHIRCNSNNNRWTLTRR